MKALARKQQDDQVLARAIADKLLNGDDGSCAKFAAQVASELSPEQIEKMRARFMLAALELPRR